jgi:hypothetical protein
VSEQPIWQPDGWLSLFRFTASGCAAVKNAPFEINVTAPNSWPDRRATNGTGAGPRVQRNEDETSNMLPRAPFGLVAAPTLPHTPCRLYQRRRFRAGEPSCSWLALVGQCHGNGSRYKSLSMIMIDGGTKIF